MMSLVLQKLFKEGVKVVLESVEQRAVEHHGLFVVDDDQVLQCFVVFVDENETESVYA